MSRARKSRAKGQTPEGAHDKFRSSTDRWKRRARKAKVSKAIEALPCWTVDPYDCGAGADAVQARMDNTKADVLAKLEELL
jgi:hypothetical protein